MFVGSLPKFNNCSMDSLKLEQRCFVLFSLIVTFVIKSTLNYCSLS